MYETTSLLLVLVFILSITLPSIKWYNDLVNKSVKDYESAKRPTYVYFETAHIDMPFSMYLITLSILSTLLLIVGLTFLQNVFAGVILGLTTFIYGIQRLKTKSHKISESIDQNLSLFLIHFYNVYQHKNEPISALNDVVDSNEKSVRITLKKMAVNIENGSEPSKEISKAKQKFLNPILRDFLDSLLSDLQKGGNMYETLSRLMDRAEQRKRYSSERKVGTYGPRMFIRICSVVFFIALLGVLGISEDNYIIFTENAIGKAAISIMLFIVLLINMIANKLAVLSEG